MRNLTAPFILIGILSLGGTSFAAAVRGVRAMSAFARKQAFSQRELNCLLRPPMTEVNIERRPVAPQHRMTEKYHDLCRWICCRCSHYQS